jgi:hypothetical protein
MYTLMFNICICICVLVIEIMFKQLLQSWKHKNQFAISKMQNGNSEFRDPGKL